WINGTLLAARPCGYVSSEYELTPYLNHDGINVIAVRLDNNQPNSRWYSGSGIYRNVWLTVLNPVHVGYCGLFVTTPSVTANAAVVNVRTQLLNQSTAEAAPILITEIFDANGGMVASHTSAPIIVSAGGAA